MKASIVAMLGAIMPDAFGDSADDVLTFADGRRRRPRASARDRSS